MRNKPVSLEVWVAEGQGRAVSAGRLMGWSKVEGVLQTASVFSYRDQGGWWFKKGVGSWSRR